MSTHDVVIHALPKIAATFAAPRGSVRYRGLHGGRGGGKSLGAAEFAAISGYVEPLRVLCGREFQNSIKESFHQELKTAIEKHEFLADFYDVGVDYLRAPNGTEFLFKGLRHSIATLKSTASIDLTILEEAENIPENSWLALEATVFRRPKAELWALWNPAKKGSPVDNRFRGPNRYHDAIVTEINWQDNPMFPAALDKLRRDQLERLDPDTYHHIWEGGYLTNSASQVYGGRWSIMDFTPQPHWDGPYYGGDFGFANDPLAAVRMWIVDRQYLMIEYEAGAVNLDLHRTVQFLKARIPGIADYVSRWDSARPESISYLRQHGMPRATPCVKWAGSVEDGIQAVRAFKKIYVHPRCTNTINELRLYSYKVDRLTGDVTPDIVDDHNHYLDAVRYGIGPLIKRGKQAAMLLSSSVQ